MTDDEVAEAARARGRQPALPTLAEDWQFSGLTILEAFTMSAMGGICSLSHSLLAEQTAKRAIGIAEATLRELARRGSD